MAPTMAGEVALHQLTLGERTASRKQTEGPIRIALVGVPNSGKSVLFHRLSGRFSTSSNYPHTTVALEQAEVDLGDRKALLIDSPGLTGLELASEDEALTRQLLQGGKVDAILQSVDAGSLKRSLVLTAQLADLEIPLVVCLNMVDEAHDRGIVVDPEVLSAELGVPVISACAIDGRGVKRLGESLPLARIPKQIPYPRYIRERLAGLTPVASRAHRVERVLTEADPEQKSGQSVWHMAIEAHRDWADGVVAKASHATGLEPQNSIWRAIERAALHPVGAWLFLLAAISAVFFSVSELGANIIAGGLDGYLITPFLDWLASLLGKGLLAEVLIGDFGILSLGVFNALGTVLPILGVFYLLYGFMEDIGYFPLLSVQFDRMLRVVGLNGTAVLPVTLGFGCNAMAVMSARCLKNERERFIAAFLISLGVPCAVQLGVMVAILATVPVAAMAALLLTIGVVQVGVGVALAKFLPQQQQGDFLVELPPLRQPRWRNIFSKTYRRLREFIVEAVPLFVASAGLLLILKFTGILEWIRDLLAPMVVSGLGLPRDFADMLLITLARREIGAVMLKDAVDKGSYDLRQVFVSLLVMTLFVPCLTTSLAVGRMIGWRKSLVIFFAVCTIAMMMGTAANVMWPQ